jgi:2-keto-3-deoxy-L-fuconate dehydrogenase
MKFKDKVVVITGGASGIGRASAIAFAREGARVAIVDADGKAASDAAAELQSAGALALARGSDVAAPGSADADAAAILAAWGRIDVLVTAAGRSSGGTVTTTEPKDWTEVFRVNVDGTWLWARAVIPAMQKAKRGAIVLVASQLALAGGRGNSAYIASKGAIISLTRTMALDYVADGIRVNAVAPGATETPMLARAFARNADPEAARKRSAARHAMGRLGKPQEIAAGICFLAGDDAAFITGHVLPVEGGWLAA